MPSANGNGEFGESLTSPILAKPGEGASETFLSIGLCDTENAALSVLKYVKTKTFRALMGILKTTQHLTPGVMKYVPMQTFDSNEDIDWSKSISDIDRQLYSKYGLSIEEIEFIETHVQEMN